MTGDGVNDAPALRQSDIGVAVEASADLAKDAADLILLDNNFASIVAAIEEGRGIFYNIKKFISFLLSVNFDEIVVIMLSLFMGLPLPLLPIHLLWLNVVTDSFPALALANDPYPDNLLASPPYNPTKEIMRGIMSVAVISAFLASTAVMSTFLLELFVFSKNVMVAQTMAFTVTVLYELALVFVIRSNKRLKNSKPFENKYLIAAVVFAVFLQLFVVYVPQVQMFFNTVTLGWTKWIIMLPMISVGVLGFEANKILGYWKLGKQKKVLAEGL
jgi:Ca2+-transporting ATPase